MSQRSWGLSCDASQTLIWQLDTWWLKDVRGGESVYIKPDLLQAMETRRDETKVE